jgi:ribosome-binding factor A
MASHKVERIASDINKYLSNILLIDTNDELLKNITIIDTVVSKDLSYAKVYFTSLLNMDHKDLEREVNEAAPFLRKELAKVLDIRNIPELKFIYDTSIEYASNIENIIKKINEE